MYAMVQNHNQAIIQSHQMAYRLSGTGVVLVVQIVKHSSIFPFQTFSFLSAALASQKKYPTEL